MHSFIIFHGLSKSGKTSCCYFLKDKFKIPRVTPIDRYKEFIEEVYGLYKGFLNFHSKKRELIPGTEWTWEDLLVKSFHFYRSLDPGFSSKLLVNEIICYLAVADSNDKNLYLCLDSIRNPEEIQALIFLKSQFNIELNLIEISSPFERNLESDCYFVQNKNLFDKIYDNKFLLKNNTTIKELQYKLLNIFDEIIKDKDYV